MYISLLVPAQQTTHPSSQKLEVESFGNRLEQQFWVRYAYGNVLAQVQNYRSTDGKAALSLPLIGYRFKLSEAASVSVIGGRQYTYNTNKWDRTVLFANGQARVGKVSLASVNRLSFGPTFVHRHIQKVGGVLPYKLSVVADEFITPKGVTEGHIGIEKVWSWRSLKLALSPNYDAPARTPDLRWSVTWQIK